MSRSRLFTCFHRTYSTEPPRIFDRKLKAFQRDVASRSKDCEKYRYFRDEISDRLVERLEDILHKFPTAIDIGSGFGSIRKSLDGGKGGVQYLLETDISPKNMFVEQMVCDEESIPIRPKMFDAALSCLSLHWVNNLPKALHRINQSLRPDGVFMGAMFGGSTLDELRISLMAAEQEREGGVSVRISPMVQPRDAGSLLSQGGFRLTTVDLDKVTIDYPDMFTLLTHLQGMGENNAVVNRRGSIHRDTLLAANETYKSLFGTSDGRIVASFEIIYMIGWAPHPDQKKPLARGSQDLSLKELGKVHTVAEPDE